LAADSDELKVSDLSFWAAFRRFFLRGLGALLPTLLTIAILIWAYNLVDRHMGRYINGGFIAVLAKTIGPPRGIDPVNDALKYGTRTDIIDAQGRFLTREYQIINHPVHAARGSYERNKALWQIAFAKYRLGLIGFLAAVIIVWFVGFFLASLVGRRTYQGAERLFYRLPVVKAIYPYVKQVTDFILSERKLQFSGVVAVQYPRQGIWSVGLVTGSGLRTLHEKTGARTLTVFIPSSPTPFTGYTITVEAREVVELPMTIDEAIRFVVSGGVIKPPNQQVEAALPGVASPKDSPRQAEVVAVPEHSAGSDDGSRV